MIGSTPSHRHISSKSKLPKLWLALRLHQLALNVHTHNDHPVKSTNSEAIVVSEKHRVTHLTQGANLLGIRANMPIATAQALGKIKELHREKNKEEKAALHLQDICYRYTPYIEIHSSKHHHNLGLFLEISRCLKLFGGVDNFCKELNSALLRTPYEYTYALGHTKHGAWLLSHAHQYTHFFNQAIEAITTKKAIPPPTIHRLFINQINTLSVTLLNEHPKAMDSLIQTGFNTLGDVYTQLQKTHLGSLTQRLGEEVSEYIANLFDIDQSMSQTRLFSAPAKTYQPRESFHQHIQFDYPVNHTEQLRQPMQQLLEKLETFLRQRQKQAQRLHWHLFDIYKNKDSLTINGSGLSGQHHGSQQLLDLSCIQLESKSLNFDVDILELECHQLQTVHNNSHTLAFSGKKKGAGSQSFELTLARLQSRLGDEAIYKVSTCDHHIPEKTNITIPVNQTANTQLTDQQHQALRPSWLLHQPAPIHFRDRALYWYGELQLLQGPERIEGYWWDEVTARDYFIAQREDYIRVWIFYDVFIGSWFVQGVF